MELDQIFLGKIASNFIPPLTSPAQPAPGGGGARLKRISGMTPIPGQDLGMVIASPNILRAYHFGFDPNDPERTRYEGDFMDKLIYVTDADYVADPSNTAAVTLIAAGGALLGSLADPESSTGCSASSRGTPVYRLMFSGTGATWSWRFVLEPEYYTVVPAAFYDPDPSNPGRGMVATLYWIASDADRDSILTTAEYTAARVRSRSNCPSSAAGRRQLTLEQIGRLRECKVENIFESSRTL